MTYADLMNLQDAAAAAAKDLNLAETKLRKARRGGHTAAHFAYARAHEAYEAAMAAVDAARDQLEDEYEAAKEAARAAFEAEQRYLQPALF